MTITFTDFDEYLDGKGIDPTVGDSYQTMINLITAVYTSLTMDSTLILAMDRLNRVIYDVAVGYFKSGNYTVSGTTVTPSSTEGVTAWVTANRPDIEAFGTTVVEMIEDVVCASLNTSLIPSFQVVDNMSYVDTYAGLVSAVLNQLTRLLRATTGMGATTDGSANSSSYGGQSVPKLPDVTV